MTESHSRSSNIRNLSKKRVDLLADASNGLRLCLCDINPSNFKKLPGGRVAAFDFSTSCFLPPLFITVALARAQDDFSEQVARRIDCPKSDDVDAVLTASYFLVPFGRNDISQPC